MGTKNASPAWCSSAEIVKSLNVKRIAEEKKAECKQDQRYGTDGMGEGTKAIKKS